MPLQRYPTRLLFLSALSSALLLALSVTVATSVYLDQYHSANVLSEDIGSRGAAITLDTTLDSLISSHAQNLIDVEPLHEQARNDLEEIERFADKATERELMHRVKDSFNEYLNRWNRKVSPAALMEFLRNDTQVKIHELRAFNGKELRASEETHQRSVRRMVWGLTAVGSLGSVAGLVLGYGLARSLRRHIQRFLVQVRGASELLGQQLPAVEVVKGSDKMLDGTEDLLQRVEQAVQQLNFREREVRRAERLAAVGQLAAGVAHEIRNPLTSAILLIETGRKDPTSGGLTDEDLDLIEQELHRIEQTLQTFLAFARPPKLDRIDCDLRDVIREALALTRGRLEASGIMVSTQGMDRPARLVIDPAQMKQVLLNLILNSADAMPTGGELKISIQAEESTFQLRVEDNGPGIAADILPRLFVPFTTGKETGTGLGLVVCKRIVEDQGGSITGFNKETGGACFVIRLNIQEMSA